MASMASAGDPPLPEPPDPPDPPDPLSIFAQTSISNPSSISLPFSLFHHPLSLTQDLDLGLTISSLFALLRCFPAVCRSFVSFNPIASLSFRLRYDVVSGFAVSLRFFTAVCSPWKLAYLLTNVRCGMISLLVLPLIHNLVIVRFITAICNFFESTLALGAMILVSLQLQLPKSPDFSDIAPLSFAGFSTVTLIAFHLSLSQVCSSLYPAFPTVDCLRNLEEWLALVLWMSSVLPPGLKASGSRFPILLPIGSSFHAFVRFLTAVCRVSPVFSVTGYASCSFHMWQIGKNCLSCFPPVNLALDFHSPHLSVKELIFLPSTSLDLSGIVAGSIMLKVVLVRAVTKRLFVSRSSIDFVDGLTFSSLEAFIPPLGGLDQDGICCFGLTATSVELARSHLSPYLYLSCCVVLCLTLGSTNLWSATLVCLAPCGLMYPLLLEINS